MAHSPVSAADARRAAEEVEDPELPMVTVGDLGMIRGVRVDGDRAEIDVAPTYSGCPATEVIHAAVRSAVEALGFGRVEVRMVRNPPWSTSWITPRGRERLAANGIAPPPPVLPETHGPSALPVLGDSGGSDHARLFGEEGLFGDPPKVDCPFCGHDATEQISAHGSTPCKSLFRCMACREPFEHFKRH